MLYAGFNHALDRRLNALSLAPAERQNVDRGRPNLAATETANPLVNRAIAESFLSGYRIVLWIAIGLTIASALSARFLSSEHAAQTQT
jgi:hypothetical protein